MSSILLSLNHHISTLRTLYLFSQGCTCINLQFVEIIHRHTNLLDLSWSKMLEVGLPFVEYYIIPYIFKDCYWDKVFLQSWEIHHIIEMEKGSKLPLKAHCTNSFGHAYAIISKLYMELHVFLLQNIEEICIPYHVEWIP